MKKLLTSVVLAGLLTCTGCILGTLPDGAQLKESPIIVAKTVPPVTPDQVSVTNGRQIAQALAEELDREAKQK